MNATRITATAIASLVAMTLFEALIRPRIAAAQQRQPQGGNGGRNDSGAWYHW
jgi:hypothetical protein